MRISVKNVKSCSDKSSSLMTHFLAQCVNKIEFQLNCTFILVNFNW